MSEENKQTVKVYEQTAYKYIENSAEHDRLDVEKAERKRKKLEKLIKTSFSELPQNSKVFEIGSGDGSNAKFMETLGLDVTASDVANDFINEIKSKGLKAIKFNILEDDFTEKYSAFFCWRVFVHFTKKDAFEVVRKIYEALENNGIFIFNAINRDIKNVDNEWVDFKGEYYMGVERYYNYFRKEELDNIINQTKFQIVDFHKEGGDNNDKWLVYVLKKLEI